MNNIQYGNCFCDDLEFAMLSTDTMIVYFVASIYANITTQRVVYWFTVIKIMDTLRKFSIGNRIRVGDQWIQTMNKS